MHEWYMKKTYNENQVKQLVCRGTSVLLMALLGYGINHNRLRVREKMDWMVFHSDWKHLYQNYWR